MEFPDDVLSIIKEYARPVTRPDWRTCGKMTRYHFKQEFKRANVDTVKSVVDSKFKTTDDFVFPVDKFNNYVLSPAEIQSICFKNDDINTCIDELVLEQEKNIGRIKVKEINPKELI